MELVVFYLVMIFGWVGAPGEWMAWAWACVLYHTHWSPRVGGRDGPEAFRCWALMDDTVLVEPVLGLRPWLSAFAFEEGAKLLFGPEAINEEKKRKLQRQQPFFSIRVG